MPGERERGEAPAAVHWCPNGDKLRPYAQMLCSLCSSRREDAVTYAPLHKIRDLVLDDPRTAPEPTPEAKRWTAECGACDHTQLVHPGQDRWMVCNNCGEREVTLRPATPEEREGGERDALMEAFEGVSFTFDPARDSTKTLPERLEIMADGYERRGIDHRAEDMREAARRLRPTPEGEPVTRGGFVALAPWADHDGVEWLQALTADGRLYQWNGQGWDELTDGPLRHPRTDRPEEGGEDDVRHLSDHDLAEMLRMVGDLSGGHVVVDEAARRLRHLRDDGSGGGDGGDDGE